MRPTNADAALQSELDRYSGLWTTWDTKKHEQAQAQLSLDSAEPASRTMGFLRVLKHVKYIGNLPLMCAGHPPLHAALKEMAAHARTNWSLCETMFCLHVHLHAPGPEWVEPLEDMLFPRGSGRCRALRVHARYGVQVTSPPSCIR